MGLLQVQAQPAPAGLPAAQLVGAARLTVFGFAIYDARLWAGPGFSRADYARQPFALELTYLRDFEGAAIAERSLKEMQGLEDVPQDRGREWLAEMTRLFPNVKKGDRITGMHLPGVGVSFLYNGRPLGQIADPAFARLFMGIWLSPKTSEPAMREKLLAQTAP